MSCLLCGSDNFAEFTAEINLHFSGLKSLDKPCVLIFPRVLVCLDCGFSRFTTPEAELGLLRIPENKATTGQGWSKDTEL